MAAAEGMAPLPQWQTGHRLRLIMMKLVSSAVDKSGNQTKTLSECQSETRRSLDTQEGEVELAPFEISNILQIQCRKKE